MGLDVAIGELVGSLFAPAAADVGAEVGADVLGGIGSDFAASAGAGAAAEAAGIAAPDIAAAAAPEAAATLGGIGSDFAASAGSNAAADAAGVGEALANAPAAAAAAPALDVFTGEGLGTVNIPGSAFPSSIPAAAGGGAPGVAAATGTGFAGTGISPVVSGVGGEIPATDVLATGGGNAAENLALGTTPIAPPTDLSTAATVGGQSVPASVADAINGAGGSSIGSTLSSVLSSPYTKAAELGLPLAFLGYNALKGPAPLPTGATAAVTNAVNQLTPLQGQASANVPLYNETAATDLNLATNFQISPAQAASIQQWQQNQYNQLYQQIANQGVTNVTGSSEWVQGKNQIDQQALAQQVQMVNQLISTAFQSASAANAGVSTSANVTSSLDATLMQAAQLQVQQDQAFQQSLASALQSFGLIAAFGNLGGSKAGTANG